MSEIKKALKEGKPMTPLWLVAIFVSLAQTVITVALIRTEGLVQLILTWFVVLFPVIIASIFFVFLWHRPHTLYSPNEYGKCIDPKTFAEAMKVVGHNKNDYGSSISYRAMYVIKARIRHENFVLTKILTYQSIIWQCYLLLNSEYHLNENGNIFIEELKCKLADKIGVNADDLELIYDEQYDMDNVKYSYSKNTATRYYYKFLFVKINNGARYKHLLGNTFTCGGRECRWMTLAEMQADPRTLERNSDIIRYLKGAFNEFINIPFSIPEDLDM